MLTYGSIMRLNALLLLNISNEGPYWGTQLPFSIRSKASRIR